jgi:hypothetical protein
MGGQRGATTNLRTAITAAALSGNDLEPITGSLSFPLFLFSAKKVKMEGLVMSVQNRYFFETGGHAFESEIVDIVSAFAQRIWGAKAVKFSSQRQDRFEGTDMYVLGVPMDVTLAFDKKVRTRKLGELPLDGVTISFGVRFGNGRVSFKTPVLVVGADGITNGNMWLTMDIIKANIQEILDTGMDNYFLAIEA